MTKAFFFQTTRYKKRFTGSNTPEGVPIGQAQMANLNSQLTTRLGEFVKDVFNYRRLEVVSIVPEVSNQRIEQNKFTTFISQSSNLKLIDGHCSYSTEFASGGFKYSLTINKIPCKPDNRPIQLFLDIVSEFWIRSVSIISNMFETSEGRVLANENAMYLADHLTFNIKKNVFIEYLYSVFNEVDEGYRRARKLISGPEKYDIGLLEKTWDHAHELSTLKVENQPVYCGFLFQITQERTEENSVRLIKFQDAFEFGNLATIRNRLKLSNGQNVFFNVSDGNVNSLVMTRNKVKDIFLSPLGQEKRFSGRPLIVSIQGTGKIFFIEGGTDKNALLFQVVNNNPLIRDGDFLKSLIHQFLTEFIMEGLEYTDYFIDWILSLSQRNKGTSLLIGTFTSEVEDTAFKFLKIAYPSDNYLTGMRDGNFDFELLDQLTLIDGGIVLNSSLLPLYVGTMVPNVKRSDHLGTGSRHNSILNFTKEVKCLGIVISEDGPISIFKDGQEVLKI